MRAAVALLLALLTAPALAEPAFYADMSWNGAATDTGYRVYCAAPGTAHDRTTPVRQVAERRVSLSGLPDMPPGVTCKVSAVDPRGESQLSETATPPMHCRGGKCYALDVPPVPNSCGVTVVQAPEAYAVVRNASRADGARPLNRLRDPALPYSDTNKLVGLSPAAYVAAGTACEPTPLVVRTSAGFWLWTTNAGGVRGIALCQRL